jgi:hypothetical protein
MTRDQGKEALDAPGWPEHRRRRRAASAAAASRRLLPSEICSERSSTGDACSRQRLGCASVRHRRSQRSRRDPQQPIARVSDRKAPEQNDPPRHTLCEAFTAMKRDDRRRLAVTSDDSLLGLLCVKQSGLSFCSDAERAFPSSSCARLESADRFWGHLAQSAPSR